MTNTKNEVDVFIDGLDGDAKDWISYFVEYMRKNHSDLDESIYFTRPTYKLTGKNKNYIMFSNAKNHFSFNTLDFEYIKILQSKLTKGGKGKGCANVPYKNIEEREIIISAIEEIIIRQAQI